MASRLLPVALVALASLALAVPTASAQTCIGGDHNPNALANACYDSYPGRPTYTVFVPTTDGGPVCVVGNLCPGVEQQVISPESRMMQYVVFAEATVLCSATFCSVTLDTGDL